jgi:hypothetical protein
MAKADNRIKTMLNTKCSVHPSFSRIPPHEHGMKLLKASMATIYVVNIIIKLKAAYSANRRYLSTTNIHDIRISIVGITQIIQLANEVRSGD